MFMLLFKLFTRGETEEIQNASISVTIVNVNLQIHYLLSSSRQIPSCQSAHEFSVNISVACFLYKETFVKPYLWL
jgi:hypothetical protein